MSRLFGLAHRFGRYCNGPKMPGNGHIKGGQATKSEREQQQGSVPAGVMPSGTGAVVHKGALLVKLTHPADDGPDIPSPHMPQNRPAPGGYNNSGPARPPFGRNRPMDNRPGPGRPRPGGYSSGPSNQASTMKKVFIGAGKETGVGRRDLMATFENELGLSTKDIGDIDVADRFCLVEVPGELADHVVSSLQGVRFRGRSVVVRLDKAGTAV